MKPHDQLPPKAKEILAHLKHEESTKVLTPFELRIKRARILKPHVIKHRLLENKGRLICSCHAVMGRLENLLEAKWNFHTHRRSVRRSLEQGQ